MAKKDKDWTEPLLIRTFGLNRIYESFPLLAEWLDVTPQFTIAESERIAELADDNLRNVDYWNEEELKIYFVAFLLQFANYKSDLYKGFFEREISAKVGNEMLRVKVDFMLAKGIMDLVENPYFCFHEYKRSKKNPPDPITQVLLAMLVAQETNHNGKPIYGVYNIGRDWFFMVIEGKNYSVSRSYDATLVEELRQIVAVFRKFKLIMETQLID